MERNRWTTAIRCLEIALHPNTSDDEVLAAVNGFRRTAGNTPLADICAGFAHDNGSGSAHLTDIAEWTERFVRLSRENQELRRHLDLAKIDGVRQADETEQRLNQTTEELRAAQRRAALAEQRLDDARDAYAQVTEGLKHEIAELRGALDAARNPGRAWRAPAKSAPQFSDFLSAVQQGGEIPRFIQPVPEPATRSPWTA